MCDDDGPHGIANIPHVFAIPQSTMYVIYLHFCSENGQFQFYFGGHFGNLSFGNRLAYCASNPSKNKSMSS